MEIDVAVLGGGPGGYTAAIGARVVCVERAPELGGTCLRIGCIPTKAWVQTAFALKQAEETFDKLGVRLDGSHLEFAKANAWKAVVVQQMTQGVAFLFKANGVEWVKGTGTFKDANTIAAAENACGYSAAVDNRAVPRPIYTDPEIASVGLTEAKAREQYGDDVATGTFPWVANARAVMQNETVGWVKSIHETRNGEFLGLVMVGLHVMDMVKAGVIAIDAEATIEIVADSMAPHPTLSEAIKGATLVALGRAIDIPNRKRAPGTAPRVTSAT